MTHAYSFMHASYEPNFEVKGAVYSILLRPKDGGKVLGHAAAPRARNPRVWLCVTGRLRGAAKLQRRACCSAQWNDLHTTAHNF